METDTNLQSARKKEQQTAPQRYEGQYPTAGDYAEALRSWMSQMYQWQCAMAMFPYFLASMQSQSGLSGTGPSVASPTTAQQQPQTPPPAATPAATPAAQQQTTNQPQQQPQPRQQGVEYVIPSLWKRLFAEAIDFLFLFAIKLAVTFAAVDAFDLLGDVEKYDFENLGADIMADYKMALEMTSEILVLELIHRIGTCVFEALCLHRGSGGTGGATPGKKLVGLKVVRCEWVVPTLGEQALVFPASDLGIWRAVIRSVVKNFSLTFLFPVCFTLFSFQHHRTVYDIIAGSIVVEERPNQRRRRNN